MTEEVPAQMEDDEPGLPRWVKVSGLLVLLVVIALAVTKIAGVDHGGGPGGHFGSGGAEQQAPAGHTPPPGGHSP